MGRRRLPIRDPDSTTYVAAIETAEEFGRRLYLEAWNRGWSRAVKKVVIGDGAEWIRNLAETHFPGAIQIVDLDHARQHLWEVVRMRYPNDAAPQKAWMKVHQKRMLGKGKIEKLVTARRALRHTNPEVVEKIRTEAEYFEKNAERMRYPKFRRQHLFVGSGVIEAGCKTVIGSRLKQSVCSGPYAEPVRSWHSAVVISTAALRTTGRAAAPPNFHFYVAHPGVTGVRARSLAGAVLAVGFWLPGLGLGNFADAGEQAPAVLHVIVYNAGSFGSKRLREAEIQAAALFTPAGVRIEWTEATGDDTEGSTVDYTFFGSLPGCQGRLVPGALRILFAGRDPSGSVPGRLGLALPCARSGVHAVVYLESVRRLAGSWGVGVSIALGYVMAHEVGHVLLRAPGHAGGGLMRETWGPRDWSDNRWNLMFTADQGDRMRNEARRRSTDSTPAASGPSAVGPLAKAQ